MKNGANLFLIYFTSTLFQPLLSQQLNQTIRGTVIDADSKSPIELVGVKIMSNDSVKTTTTDNEGKFRLEKVPVGRQIIKFSIIGYEDAVLNNIIVTTGKEVVLNVEMHEKILIGKEIDIVFIKDKTKANNNLITNSARNFEREETERYAGSRGDPAKMAANFAGVANGNDARNDIIVRGNSPLGVEWKLEGTDIPSPNHFSTQGATGGPVSILNNNLLGSSDFLTGAFPAEYGNRMAGVFDLKLRNGNNEKTEFLGQMGFNGLEAGLEGPISKKNGSSFLVNYRYSTLELFKLAGINFGVSAIPKYQDATFKLNFPTNKLGILSIWGIGGVSNIALLDSEKDSTDWSFTKTGEDLNFGSKMGAIGLSHLYFFTDKISGKLSTSLSGTGFDIKIDTLNSSKRPYRTYTNTSAEGNYYVNYAISDKISAHHLLKIGVTYSEMSFNYKATYWSRIFNKYLDQFDNKDHSGLFQTYVHWQLRATDKLTFNNGIHYQYFMLTKSQALEPRLGMRWQFKPKQAITGAFGMHSQTLPLVYYQYKAFDSTSNSYGRNNQNLGLSKSLHFVLGYDVTVRKDLRLKLETYCQSLYNIPVEQSRHSSFSTINIGNELSGLNFVDSLWNKGKGVNYGTEITFEKFFSKNYYFLNSISLYESKYKGSDEIWRHSAYSRGFVYNLLGGVEIPVSKNKKTIGVDLKFTVAGGNRFTPVDLNRSIENRQAMYIDSLAFSKKFSDYQKLDLKISYRINGKKISQYFYIHIENILNHKNVLQQIYNQEKQEMVKQYQLGLFPYGGYKIEF